MAIDESDVFIHQLPLFRRSEEGGMRHRLKDMQLRVYTSPAHRSVQKHGTGEKQIARAAAQERGWKLLRVLRERRRDQWICAAVARRVELEQLWESVFQDGVDHVVGLIGITGLGRV